MKIDKNTDKYKFINKLQSDTIIRLFNIVKFIVEFFNTITFYRIIDNLK